MNKKRKKQKTSDCKFVTQIIYQWCNASLRLIVDGWNNRCARGGELSRAEIFAKISKQYNAAAHLAAVSGEEWEGARGDKNGRRKERMEVGARGMRSEERQKKGRQNSASVLTRRARKNESWGTWSAVKDLSRLGTLRIEKSMSERATTWLRPLHVNVIVLEISPVRAFRRRFLGLFVASLPGGSYLPQKPTRRFIFKINLIRLGRRSDPLICRKLLQSTDWSLQTI